MNLAHRLTKLENLRVKEVTAKEQLIIGLDTPVNWYEVVSIKDEVQENFTYRNYIFKDGCEYVGQRYGGTILSDTENIAADSHLDRLEIIYE